MKSSSKSWNDGAAEGAAEGESFDPVAGRGRKLPEFIGNGDRHMTIGSPEVQSFDLRLVCSRFMNE
jgi:hypothetical protein